MPTTSADGFGAAGDYEWFPPARVRAGGSTGGLPLVAIETVRRRPVERVVFAQAKVVVVMAGRMAVESPGGRREAVAGDVLVVGSGVWCSVVPGPVVRLWTIYIDEHYLRSQCWWLLPPVERVRPGVHPAVWDGDVLVLSAGSEVLSRVDPLVRRMSLISSAGPSDLAASHLAGLFAGVTYLLIPAMLDPNSPEAPAPPSTPGPILGRTALPVMHDQVAQAADLLRVRMAESWTADRLAAGVAMSTAHLRRLFTTTVGVSPMRFLTEVRLTEFARLVEETDLPLMMIARRVGWRDPRVASTWFRRRYGLSPSQFRRSRHPSCPGRDGSCDVGRGVCA